METEKEGAVLVCWCNGVHVVCVLMAGSFVCYHDTPIWVACSLGFLGGLGTALRGLWDMGGIIWTLKRRHPMPTSCGLA